MAKRSILSIPPPIFIETKIQHIAKEKSQNHITLVINPLQRRNEKLNFFKPLFFNTAKNSNFAVQIKALIFITVMTNKNNEVDPKGLKDVEETLSKTEQFLENNYKNMLTGLVVVVLLVGAFWLSKVLLGKRQDEAQAQMFQAERYFEIDSLDLALNGDGNYLGFLDIADDYKLTNSGNLAHYYAGICYLHMGEFENAIDYLQKYKKKDNVLGSMAIGAIGDAYVELGQMDKGIDKYVEAAEFGDNSFNTPLFLMKAAELHELNGEYADALALYERIEDDYPNTNEGLSIDKYIARVKVLMN